MFSKFFKKDKAEEKEGVDLPTPLDLRLGCMVSVNTLDIELFFDGQSIIDIENNKSLQIVKYSKIQLDEDLFMHRFKFKGGFFEIVSDEHCKDLEDVDVVWYHTIDSTTLNMEGFEEWAGEDGLIGQPSFSIANGDSEEDQIDYYRIINDDSEEPMAAMEMNEVIYKDELSSVDKKLHIMQYGRDIEDDSGSVEAEYLITEVEDYDGVYTVNLYAGVSVSIDKLEII